MIKFFNLTISLLLILSTITLAQDPILQGLDSPDSQIRLRTLYKINKEKLRQYGAALEARIFIEEEPYLKVHYMRALHSIHYENNETIARALIDTVNNYPASTDPISIKVLATYVLCEQFGNFSTIQYAFDILNSNYPYIMGEALGTMVLGLEVPEHFENCKNALLNIISSGKDPVSSMVAYNALTNKLGIQFVSNLVEGFQNDSDDVVRLECLKHLCNLNYSDLNYLLKTRLPLEPYEGLRMHIVDTLLNKYGNPSDLKAVIDYRPNEPHPNAKSLMGFRTRNFIPHKFDQSVTIEQMFLKINGYLEDLQNFNWLADETYKNELGDILTSAKTNLLAGDSLACRTQVKAFQDLVDNVYKDSLNPDPSFVTIEGWKFLYWNAQYILDRLPEPPILIAPKINVITPAMSLVNPGSFTMEVKGSGFNSSSAVYFNGNARATSFVSDSVLNAQILSTDVSVAGNFSVWVSNGTINSDTFIYKVVSTLPQPVRPVLECVRNNGDGTYTAFFGYKNENTVSVYIPVGSKNKFTPNPQDRGQTKVFLPGRHYKVYTVNFNGSNLVWTLNGRTSTASRTSAPCQ